MPLLPTVYAYRDDGPIWDGIQTAWNPRKVFCTRSSEHAGDSGKRYVVKYRRGTSRSAAANISEMVGHLLLRELGIRTFVGALIHVSSTMAMAYTKTQKMEYSVDAGLHFGTLYDGETESGPPLEWGQMEDPRELIAIWVVDCWMMNLDRNVEGNTRLALGANGKFHILATDQSDCFLGAGSLADGSFVARSKGHQAAPYPDKHTFVDRAAMDLGCGILHSTIQSIQSIVPRLSVLVQQVPDAWWHQANVEPAHVVQCLTERANRLRIIVDVERMEGISNFGKSQLPLL